MKKFITGILIILTGGMVMAGGSSDNFHETVNYVDMERFTGDWYVIALIPTFFEKNIANGIENYSIDENGNIRVEYTYRKGSAEGPEKVMYQKGWIFNEETNAEWRVRPLWPLKLPYYVLELAPDYSYTVIATNSYNYLWIMARRPQMDNLQLEEIIERMVQRGFDSEEIVYMEQKWRN